MKRTSYPFVNPTQRAIASMALVASIAFASSSQGAQNYATQETSARALPTPTMVADATAMQSPAAAAQTPGYVGSDKGSNVGSVEARINYLHAKLKITSAQEEQWKSVAQVMRDNADKLSTLAKERSKSEKTMTAIDNLKSYAEIAEAHEDGTKKLIPAFQSLYNNMSDDQKKAADAEFREHGHHQHHHHHNS
jgi:protein CpxP